MRSKDLPESTARAHQRVGPAAEGRAQTRPVRVKKLFLSSVVKINETKKKKIEKNTAVARRGNLNSSRGRALLCIHSRTANNSRGLFIFIFFFCEARSWVFGPLRILRIFHASSSSFSVPRRPKSYKPRHQRGSRKRDSTVLSRRCNSRASLAARNFN